MTELRDLAEELIEHPSAEPPPLDQLERRARTLRRRHAALRLGAVGVVVAALAGAAVWAGTHQEDAFPPADPRPDMPHPPDLRPIGREVTVGSGVIDGDGVAWALVAYEVAPATPDGPRRVCSEFRSTRTGPQSCFSVFPTTEGSLRWSFVERHHGRNFLVVAAEPGSAPTLDHAPLALTPPAGLPVAFAAQLLPVGGFEAEFGDGAFIGTITVRDGGPFLGAEGSRQLFLGGADGTYLEPMVSSHPDTDGWMAAAVDGAPSDRAYVEPSQAALWGHRDYDETIVLYDDRGRRVGSWEECGAVLTGQDPPTCQTPTTAD